MRKEIRFMTTLVSGEVKTTFKHMQYMQCKSAHGHFVNLVDCDHMRIILPPYIRQFDIDSPVKFDEIVNKIVLMKIPLNVRYRVRKFDEHVFGEIDILPVEEV